MIELDRLEGIATTPSDVALPEPEGAIQEQALQSLPQPSEESLGALRAAVTELHYAAQYARALSQKARKQAGQDLPVEEGVPEAGCLARRLASGPADGGEAGQTGREGDVEPDATAGAAACAPEATVLAARAEIEAVCTDLRDACESLGTARNRALRARWSAEQALADSTRQAAEDAARREAEGAALVQRGMQMRARREEFEAKAQALEPSLADMRRRLEAAEAESRKQRAAHLEEVERCQQLTDRAAGRERLIASREKTCKALASDIEALKADLEKEKRGRVSLMARACWVEMRLLEELNAAARAAGEAAAAGSSPPDSFMGLAILDAEYAEFAAAAPKHGRAKRGPSPRIWTRSGRTRSLAARDLRLRSSRPGPRFDATPRPSVRRSPHCLAHLRRLRQGPPRATGHERVRWHRPPAAPLSARALIG